MARKNANSSPGVWLGLLLVLVAHSLALNTLDENITKLEKYPSHDDSFGRSFPDNEGVGEPPLTRPDKNHDTSGDYAKDLRTEKQMDELSDVKKSADSTEPTTSKLSNKDEVTKPVTTIPETSTLGDSSKTIPAGTTVASEKNSTTEQGGEIVATTQRDVGIESLGVQNHTTDSTILEESKNETSTDSDRELELTEEHVDFEDHTSSELAEGTTPSSNSSVVDRQTTQKNSIKNTEHFYVDETDDRHASSNGTISLENDTNVNNHKNPEDNSRDHQVEIFKNDPHPTSLRISEETGSETAGVDNTTPNYSSSKPKGRTISITGDNDLSKKMSKNISVTNGYQTTSDTIMRIFPKKSVSSEKPTELKPYPYHKSETKFAENPDRIEESTEEISAHENTIGRKKTDEKIVVTEPSVLVENSIQQFKPIHDKRSGNLTKVNSTFDNPVASTAWSLATSEDLGAKNVTGLTEESQTTIVDIGNRSQINNDVPQDNPNNSVTTERSRVILSEVTENNIETIVEKINGTYNLTSSTPISKQLTEETEFTASDVAKDSSKSSGTEVANSTERIVTILNSSSTSNEIQTETNDPEITPTQKNFIDESTEQSVSRDNSSTISEINTIDVSNTTEKFNSDVQTPASSPVIIFTTTESGQEFSNETSTLSSNETKLIEDNVANVTGLEPISETRDTTLSITESTIGQTTNVEYEFVELTTTATDFTISQDDVTNSETTNTTFDITNDTLQTTESQETAITEEPVEQNQTTLMKTIETVTPASQPLTTLSIDTTTSFNNNSEVTTIEDASNTKNFPVSESNLNAVTEISNVTALPSTTYVNNASRARIDVPTNNDEYTTTTIVPETILPTEEPTTISNIEVIVSSVNTTTPTTVTQSTTVHIQSISEPPEFPISSTDVTSSVSVIVEGSWSDVCPVLSNLRSALANLLTEGTESTVLPRNIILLEPQCPADAISSTMLTPVIVYVVNDDGDFDYTMTDVLPSLYNQSPFSFPLTIRSVEKVEQTDNDPGNNAIAVVAVSSVAFICLVLLAGLLFIMRKRQTRFNYGGTCQPVSLDAFRVDSVSAYNSVRRKDLTRASKRSYGNPAFEDSSVTPTHPLNFAGLSSFCNDSNAITEEFAGIPQVTARMDELPAGAEVKNRYANVAPLPETRVLLQKINNEPLTEYINASYVRGPKNATKYYIACQAPMESTVSDFWRMIWEQQSKVIIMLTDIVENGVEKCVEYIPPSEVTDCHRLYGDYQVTLKKREAKEKYAISTLHLKNLENNTYREVSHIWYLWPTNGVPSNATGLIAILLEARALQRGAPGPIVIHCSPGTGRTGTLIALDLGIRQYEITRTIDVPRVVYTIRRDRAGAVQTKEQYAFIYKALNLYAAKLAGGALESM